MVRLYIETNEEQIDHAR